MPAVLEEAAWGRVVGSVIDGPSIPNEISHQVKVGIDRTCAVQGIEARIQMSDADALLFVSYPGPCIRELAEVVSKMPGKDVGPRCFPDGLAIGGGLLLVKAVRRPLDRRHLLFDIRFN